MKRKLPNNQRQIEQSRETDLAIKVPYSYHYNADTVATKNGWMLQAIHYDGLFTQKHSKERVKHYKKLLAEQLASLNDERITVYQHTIRRKASRYPGGSYTNPFARLLNERWENQLSEESLYTNQLFHTMVARPFVGAKDAMINWFGKFSLKIDKQQRDLISQDMVKLLNDKTHKLVTALAEYGPRKLTVYQKNEGTYSQLLAYLGYLVNQRMQPVRLPHADISHYITSVRPYFFHNTFILESPSGRRYGAMLGVKEYCGETDAGLLDSLYSLPYEFVSTQSFSYINQAAGVELMSKEIRAFEKSEDYSETQYKEIIQARDSIQSGKISLGYHHLSVCCMADSETELNQAVIAIDTALTNAGLIVLREDLNMENAFYGQLPGNTAHLARVSPITTHNFAGFGSLHNQPIGKLENNHWGEALSLLPTLARSPFYFNFHLDDLGFTTAIGPSGSGKTTALAFMTAMAQKYPLRTIIFDKDRSNEILVNALGGNYQRIVPGQRTGFAPLRLADTPTNRQFLRNWLTMLVMITEEKALTPEEKAHLETAIAGNYKLPVEHRNLSDIAPYLGRSGPGTLQSRLAPWYGTGPYAYLFDNTYDTMNFADQVTGLDVTHLLNDDVARRPVITYLLYRLEQILDGHPTLVWFEEGWRMIRDTDLEAGIEDALKTWRKRNGTVLFSSNDPLDVAKSNIASTLIQQTATNIYFPNYKADKHTYNALGCTDDEWELIKNMNPAHHVFLVKQGLASVTLQLDLSKHPDIIKVISGTEKTVRELEKLRQQVGMEPSQWLTPFMQGVSYEHSKKVASIV